MSTSTDNSTKKVIVAVDLSQAGFRQAKVVLHDIFDPEVKISTTSTALKEGIIFEIGNLDAHLYFIPKK